MSLHISTEEGATVHTQAKILSCKTKILHCRAQRRSPAFYVQDPEEDLVENKEEHGFNMNLRECKGAGKSP